MAQLVFALGTFVMIGFIWFFIVRPALEGLGFLIVSDYQVDDTYVMSRSEDASIDIARSDLRQTVAQTPDQTALLTYNRAGMLDIYKLLRKYGIPREEARAALNAARLPLDNNAWADAAPPPPQNVTPIAQRPTNAVFENAVFEIDPDYPYVSPPA